MQLEPGQVLLHYRLVEKLGEGGMGVVYLAEDTKLKRRVALKVLAPRLASDATRVRRFHREAEAVAALSHPNIVTIFSVEQADDLHFLTMELIGGKTLDQLIPTGGMSMDRFFEIALPLTDAVAFAHEHGVTHRDLKLANISVGDDGRVRVLDFGLAKLAAAEEADRSAQATVTQEGQVAGTLPYMSPQQVQGQPVDHRSDVFSMGVLLHEMLRGERPFQGDSSATLVASILRDEAPPLTRHRDGLPEALEPIVRKCLEKDPARRYQTGREVSNQLKQLREDVSKGTAPTALPSAPGSPVERSIAVLPFANLSADPENEYFCDGLAEELINTFSKIGRLRVAARTTAFSLKGEKIDLPAIGRKLGVETVLEGSVRKAGNRVRVTTRLSNTADGYQLWSERFDRDMDDIFAIQDEISLSIADKLKLELLGGEKSAVVRRYTDNLDAYHLYLKGRYFAYTRKGIDFFERAIETDPAFALAYAGLADTYSVIGLLGFVPYEKLFSKAKAAAEKALELDDTLAEAHSALAVFKFWLDHDWRAAERELQRAIELKPRYSPAHCWYGNLLAFLGKSERGIEEITTAQRLDPLSPLIQAMACWVFYAAGRYEEAIRHGRAALELDPNSVGALYIIALPYKVMAMYDEAIASLNKAVELSGRRPFFLGLLGHTLGVAGKGDEARKIASDLEERSKREYVSALLHAWIHLGLGEHERAVDWFETAFEQGVGPYHFFLGEAMYDGIRSNPRFRRVLKAIGMEHWASA